MELAFANPAAVWFLAAPAGLWWLMRAGVTVRRAELQRLMDEQLFCRIAGSQTPATAKRRANTLLKLAAFFLFGLAALRPQGAADRQTVDAAGLNVSFVLDVSQSMLATDLQPSRLEGARRLVSDILELAPIRRFSLVTFSATAFVELPLTSDLATLNAALHQANPATLPIPGTRLKPALERALETLGAREELGELNEGGAVVLLSDGENFNEDLSPILKRLRALRVPVFAVGLGSAEGAPIPSGTKGEFKRDQKGEVVLSRLSADTLKLVAAKTRGRYLPGENGFAAASEISAVLGALNQGAAKRRMQTYSRRELFQWPLALGLMFWIFAERQSRRSGAALGFLLFLLAFMPFSARAENSETALALGNQSYRAGDFKSALTHYEQSASAAPENSAAKFQALYNAGNALAQLEKYEAAAARYEQALAINAQDKEAVSNLEYVRRKQQDEQQGGQQTDSQQNQQPAGNNSRPAEDRDSQQQSKQNADSLLGNLEEKRLDSLKKRYEQAVRELEKNAEQVPENDW